MYAIRSYYAHVVFYIFGCLMVFEVIVQNHVMDETNRTSPVVLRQRIAQRNVEREVRELSLQFAEIFLVEDFVL